MHQTPESERFLRAAVKAGLRLQRCDATDPASAANGNGGPSVATLQKIKASLRKKNSKKNL